MFDYLEGNYQFDLSNEESINGLEEFLDDLIQNKIIVQLGTCILGNMTMKTLL